MPLLQASELEAAPAYAVPFGLGNTTDKDARMRTDVAFNEAWARATFSLDELPQGRLQHARRAAWQTSRADRMIEALRNDGTGIPRRAGSVALAKGKHEITIEYFANDNQGTSRFPVGWAGPGFSPMGIPAANLSH